MPLGPTVPISCHELSFRPLLQVEHSDSLWEKVGSAMSHTILMATENSDWESLRPVVQRTDGWEGP